MCCTQVKVLFKNLLLSEVRVAAERSDIEEQYCELSA
jgi:hypothetical protein